MTDLNVKLVRAINETGWLFHLHYSTIEFMTGGEQRSMRMKKKEATAGGILIEVLVA